jgi:hypothetical protein
MKGHNTEDCRKKNGAQSQALTQPQSPNQIQAYGTTCQTSQVPEYNGVPIQFNEPCQLCGLTGHSARECSTCNGFVAPQAGKYFPQTYPAPGAIQALYQSPQAQWQQQQQQLCQGYPSSSCELIGEEISMRPLYPPSVQYVPEPNRGGYHQYFEYSRPEIACERLKMRDSDGDFIMGNSWECGDCLIPGRDDDGWERWSCATCPHQPLAQIGWAGYC